MDEFNSTFGRLSTNATEWKPPTSDLNAGAVKEFIPGRGWISTEGGGQQQQGRPTYCCVVSYRNRPFLLMFDVDSIYLSCGGGKHKSK
jgi:hypothetical protein